jgi:hypothetical protein
MVEKLQKCHNFPHINFAQKSLEADRRLVHTRSTELESRDSGSNQQKLVKPKQKAK